MRSWIPLAGLASMIIAAALMTGTGRVSMPPLETLGFAVGAVVGMSLISCLVIGIIAGIMTLCGAAKSRQWYQTIFGELGGLWLLLALLVTLNPMLNPIDKEPKASSLPREAIANLRVGVAWMPKNRFIERHYSRPPAAPTDNNESHPGKSTASPDAQDKAKVRKGHFAQGHVQGHDDLLCASTILF